MSLLDATVAAAIRAMVIAVGATAFAWWVLPRLRGLSGVARSLLIGATATVFFAPSMLAGYGWLPTVASWPAGSLERECLYAFAVFLRLAPIAGLALWLANPGPGGVARHAWKLAGGGGWKFRLREAGAGPWLAGGAVFLLAFQEFDLATSWGIRTWTVALFDAQIGGLAMSESLKLAAMPFAVEVAVILPLWIGASGKRRDARTSSGVVQSGGNAIAFGYAFLALAMFIIIPGFALFRLGADGFRAWMESPSMVREIVNALISGGVAAVLAWSISGLRARSWRALLASPGLIGPLMLGLLALAGLRFAPAIASSVVPWLLALTLAILPYAVLLRLLLETGARHAALRVAQLSGARAVVWEIWRERAVAAGMLLFCLGYSDFTVATLLAPPQFPTIFPRVFNLMHYGQSSVLSFTVLVAIVTPVACAALTLLLLRRYVRQRVR